MRKPPIRSHSRPIRIGFALKTIKNRLFHELAPGFIAATALRQLQTAILFSRGTILHEKVSFLCRRGTILHEKVSFLCRRETILHEKVSFLRRRETILHEKESFLRRRETILHEKDTVLREKVFAPPRPVGPPRPASKSPGLPVSKSRGAAALSALALRSLRREALLPVCFSQSLIVSESRSLAIRAFPCLDRENLS